MIILFPLILTSRFIRSFVYIYVVLYFKYAYRSLLYIHPVVFFSFYIYSSNYIERCSFNFLLNLFLWCIVKFRRTDLQYSFLSLQHLTLWFQLVMILYLEYFLNYFNCHFCVALAVSFNAWHHGG